MILSQLKLDLIITLWAKFERKVRDVYTFWKRIYRISWNAPVHRFGESLLCKNRMWPYMTRNVMQQKSLHQIYSWTTIIGLICIWSSWRLRLINDETVAAPTRSCRWVCWFAILAWRGLEKEVTYHRLLGSKSRNFHEARIPRVSLRSAAICTIYTENPRGGPSDPILERSYDASNPLYQMSPPKQWCSQSSGGGGGDDIGHGKAPCSSGSLPKIIPSCLWPLYF